MQACNAASMLLQNFRFAKLLQILPCAQYAMMLLQAFECVRLRIPDELLATCRLRCGVTQNPSAETTQNTPSVPELAKHTQTHTRARTTSPLPSPPPPGEFRAKGLFAETNNRLPDGDRTHRGAQACGQNECGNTAADSAALAAATAVRGQRLCVRAQAADGTLLWSTIEAPPRMHYPLVHFVP